MEESIGPDLSAVAKCLASAGIGAGAADMCTIQVQNVERAVHRQLGLMRLMAQSLAGHHCVTQFLDSSKQL